MTNDNDQFTTCKNTFRFKIKNNAMRLGAVQNK